MTMHGNPLDIDTTVIGIPVDSTTLNTARRIWIVNLNREEYSYIRRTLDIVNRESFVPQFRNTYMYKFERFMLDYYVGMGDLVFL